MTDITFPKPDKDSAFWLKWGASILQIVGYGATAFEVTPLNLYCFTGGLLGWLVVGMMWNDRAIMLIHAIALAALIAGTLAT